jgi:anti-sigma-K factor RskA
VSTSDHDRWEEDAAAHALGALDGEESAAFEAHMEGCEECRVELVRLMSTVELLPASVEQLTPPPSLRRELMATVRAEAARPTSGSGASARRRFRLPRLRTLSAVAVAGTIAVAFAIASISGDGDLRPDATVPVEALAPSREASASLVREGESWTLDVKRLPEIPEGTVYQVWIRSSRGLKPSSAFVLSGDRTAEVAMRERLHDGDEVMVTHEKRRGHGEPTSAPLLQARI